MNSAHFTVTSFGTRAKPYPGKSAKTKSGCGFPGRRTWKKLMVCVRPGVLLVLAILLPTSELIRLDLPTLERPTKAISGAPGGGNCRGSAAEVTKRVSTFMPYYRRCDHKVQGADLPAIAPVFRQSCLAANHSKIQFHGCIRTAICAHREGTFLLLASSNPCRSRVNSDRRRYRSVGSGGTGSAATPRQPSRWPGSHQRRPAHGCARDSRARAAGNRQLHDGQNCQRRTRGSHSPAVPRRRSSAAGCARRGGCRS